MAAIVSLFPNQTSHFRDLAASSKVKSTAMCLKERTKLPFGPLTEISRALTVMDTAENLINMDYKF